MSVKQHFMSVYDALMSTPPFLRLAAWTENSQWHRESSIYEHTRMVVAEYVNLVGDREWTMADFLGGIACVFHDLGKPDRAHKGATGKYSFHGHEQRSMELFLEHPTAQQMTKRSRMIVAWMIQHHLPFGTAAHAKLAQFGRWMTACGDGVFQRVLLADQLGRLSDTKDENLMNVQTWMTSKLNTATDRVTDVDLTAYAALTDMAALFQDVGNQAQKKHPLLVLPIGPSGSGKSTLFNRCLSDNPDVMQFSWDELRLTMYGGTYEEAFAKYVVDEEAFNERAGALFKELVSSRRDVYVDNTNLDGVRFHGYVDTALNFGYDIIYVVFDAPIATLLERQNTRTDKTVPPSSIYKQAYLHSTWMPYKPSQVLFTKSEGS